MAESTAAESTAPEERRLQNPDDPDVDATRRLRRHLKLYFYSAFKWKSNTFSIHLIFCVVMFLQLIKIAFITDQMFLFGHTRSYFSSVVSRGHTTLRHLLLHEWDSGWETLPYPPAQGEFASYHTDHLTEAINHAINRYYNAPDDAIGFYKRIHDDHMTVKVEYYDFEGFAGSTSKGLSILSKEFPVDVQNVTDPETGALRYTYHIEDGFKDNNLSEPIKRLLRCILPFNIHSVRINTEQQEARCLSIYGEVSFSDLDNNGQMKLNLETTTTKIRCLEIGYHIKDVELDPGFKTAAYAVLVFTALSILVTLIGQLFGLWVLLQTKAYMKENYQQYYKPLDQNERDLPLSEYMVFLKFWDVITLLSDALNMYGTVWLLFRMDNDNLTLNTLDVLTVWISIGCTLTWASMLRYLKFHQKFHLLFSTVYNSFGNVMAYMLCVLVLFIGFWISGFVVLGPYHVKFETPGIAADTLFSIINGDEIFATLHLLEDDKLGGKWVWWFSRVYLYAYVCIFSIVVINILIAIFMSAYEIVQEESAPKAQRELTPIETSLNTILASEDEDGSNAIRSALLDLIQGKVERRLTWDEDILKKELTKILRKHSAVVHKPRKLMAFMEDESYTSHVYQVGCCKCTFASFLVPDE